MSLLCAWCGHWIKKETPVGLISHGVCRTCADRMLAKMLADEQGRPEKPCLKH